jgi:pilus assembly protein Flp/PilA
MGETGKVGGVSDATRGRPAGGLVARFALNEKGATAIEYGMIAALLSVFIIAAITSMSETLETKIYAAIAAMVSATT